MRAFWGTTCFATLSSSNGMECIKRFFPISLRWSGELLVITHQGALTSYYLGVSDGVVHQAHSFLFTWPYAMGISTAILVPDYNILLLGGVTSNDEGAPTKFGLFYLCVGAASLSIKLLRKEPIDNCMRAFGSKIFTML